MIPTHKNGATLNNAALGEGKGRLDSLFLRAGVLIFLFAALFYDSAHLLVRTWAGRDDYSHGFIVPFISLYLAWADRERLKSIEARPGLTTGILALTLGCAMLIAGNAGGISILEQMAPVVIIPAAVLMLLGSRFVRALALPLFYLIFMVPVFDYFISRAHWPAQMFTATVAAKALGLIGVPVFQNMQFLELPNISLEVAKECSGINYLLSIVAVGIPLAWITQAGIKRRAILVSLAVLVGIIANSLRVTLIGVWGYLGGAVVHGPMHVFQGFFVSMAGFAFLFAAAWFMGIKKGPRGKKAEEIAPFNWACFNGKRFRAAWTVLVLMFIATTGFTRIHSIGEIGLDPQAFNRLPDGVRGWSGRQFVNSFRANGADLESSIIFRNGSGRELMFYLGYFAAQRQDKEMVNYSLNFLYNNSEETEIVGPNGQRFKVNRAIVKEGGRRFLFLYWYDINGRIVADRRLSKLYTAIDGVFHGRTNGAIVVLSGDVADDGALQAVYASETELASGLMPVLKDILGASKARAGA